MRNENCRVSICDLGGSKVGRGFIADARHVLTCRHVVGLALGHGGTPSNGDRVQVVTNDDAQNVVMEVVKVGGASEDVCALVLIDGGSFAATDCARWAPGLPGAPYFGLGMSREFDGIPLSGKLGAPDSGSLLQFVTADALDNKIEQGSSGAALFKPPDGPMVGMVVSLQQYVSGQIYRADALARFWPGLLPIDAAPDEGFPLLTAPLPFRLPVDKMIREVDRWPQKTRLATKIDAGDLLNVGGFVVAAFAALADDLPFECAQALRQRAFAKHLGNLASDSDKAIPCYFGLRDVVGDGTEAPGNLLALLAEALGAPSPRLDSVRAALHDTLTPLAIVLTGRIEDLDSLTPEVMRACADVLRQVAIPDEDQPVALFIVIRARLRADLPDIRQRLGELGSWYVALPPLSQILDTDVTNWAMKRLGENRQGQDARDRIAQVLAQRSGGREEFSLGDLKTWFSAVD